MSLFNVVNNQVQLDAGNVASTDAYAAGIRFTQGGAARTTRFAGTSFNQGIPMSPTGQVAIVDATSGLPADAIYLNGLPISGNKVCVGLNATSVVSNGLPFDSNGVLVGSLPGFTTLALDFINGATTLDPRITFSRGTNATLTDSNGRIAWAPHNLLTNSEDFEAAAWVKTSIPAANSAINSNQAVAPDGTNTADLLYPLATGASAYLTQTVTSPSQVVFSFYAKAQNKTCVWAYADGSALYGIYYVDLSNGSTQVVAGSVNTATLTATLVGAGWYRVVITWTNLTSVAKPFGIGVSDAKGSLAVTANGTDGIFIWGAQLNVGSTAQSYNSTTPKNLLGFTQEPENAAWTKSNSYVQQNLLTWSQDFDNAAVWTAFSTIVSANASGAPDGTSTADLVAETTAISSHSVYQAVNVVSGLSYTVSVFVKKGAGATAPDIIQLTFGSTGFGTGQYANFYINTGVLGTVAGGTASITSAGGGWYRISFTATATSTASANNSAILFTNNNDSLGRAPIYAGVTTSDVFIWGAQLVQGSTAGDYTQTTSAAAPTRYTNWDGTLTGRKFVMNSGVSPSVANSDGLRFVLAVSSGAYTYSLYAKAGEFSVLRVRENAATGGFLDCNLLTGNITVSGFATAQYVNPTAVNVGNGWWRVAWTSPSGMTNAEKYSLRVADTGDGTSGIYVSDFQLSNSASVDPYVYNPQAAAASAAYYGPRFDYDPVTLASRGLLIEEQRTNLLLYSEQFDNAYWAKLGGAITANAASSPDGTVNADSFIEDTSTGLHIVYRSVSITSGTVYTLSYWAKRGVGSRDLSIRLDNGTSTLRSFVNLATGAVSANALHTVTAKLFGSYWYVTCTVTATATTSVVVGAEMAAAGNVVTYTGDGTSSIDIWGAQLEAGSFATSYIPTVASQVTRNADSASMLGDNFYTWYNPNQGTLSGESTLAATGGNQRAICSCDFGATNNDSFRISFLSSNVTNIGEIRSGGSLVASILAGSFTAGQVAKAAFGAAPNNANMASNGAIGTLDTSLTMPAPDRINLGYSTQSAAYLNGHIRRIGYYNTRLPDSTLQALTT